MRLVIWGLFILGAWKWGDWKNWKKYEGSIYYAIIFSLVYTVLTLNSPMWEFKKDSSIPFLTTNGSISIGFSFIIFPCLLFVYLGHFPMSLKKSIAWIGFWVALLSSVEYFSLLKGLIVYHNHWGIFHSIIFNTIMFPMIWLYQRQPLLTLGLSMIITLAYCFIFNVKF